MQHQANYDGGQRFVHLCAFGLPLFTGKERDSESGLDNFGKRYNASTMGRFMTPDPIMIMKQKLREAGLIEMIRPSWNIRGAG